MMQSNPAMGRLSLGTLRCVREVLVHQSVTAAAERMGMTQSAASQQIARFEKASGIRVMGRAGGRLVVRADKVAHILNSIAEMIDELGQLTHHGDKPRIRLGLSGYMASFLLRDDVRCRSLGDEFEIHIGRASDLVEMYANGTLDLVVRPLFRHEADTDLMTEIGLKWVTTTPWSGLPNDPDRPIPVVLGTHFSPFTYYAERLLKEARTPYRVVARIDSDLVGTQFAASGLGCIAVPAFFTGSLPPNVLPAAGLPASRQVRYGIYFNRKAVPHRTALQLFETLCALVES